MVCSGGIYIYSVRCYEWLAPSRQFLCSQTSHYLNLKSLFYEYNSVLKAFERWLAALCHLWMNLKAFFQSHCLKQWRNRMGKDTFFSYYLINNRSVSLWISSAHFSKGCPREVPQPCSSSCFSFSWTASVAPSLPLFPDPVPSPYLEGRGPWGQVLKLELLPNTLFCLQSQRSRTNLPEIALQFELWEARGQQ